MICPPTDYLPTPPNMLLPGIWSNACLQQCICWCVYRSLLRVCSCSLCRFYTTTAGLVQPEFYSSVYISTTYIYTTYDAQNAVRYLPLRHFEKKTAKCLSLPSFRQEELKRGDRGQRGGGRGGREGKRRGGDLL